MADIAGFPYLEVEFDKNGALVDASRTQQLATYVGEHSVSDLLVSSHGWNNDMAEARDLYKRFFARTREVLDTLPALKTRKFAVLGVHWPSKKFAEQTLIPGGAAGLHSQVDASQIKAQLQALKGFLTIRKQIRSFKKRRHSSIAWKTKPRRAKNLSIAARFAARAGQSGQGKPGGIFQDRRR